VGSGELLKHKEKVVVTIPGMMFSLYRAGLTPDQSPTPALMRALWEVATGQDTHSLKVRDPLQYLTPEQWQAVRSASPGTKVYVGLRRPGLWLTLAMSGDGRTVATGDVMGNIHLWEVATGKELSRFSDAAKMPIISLAFAQDGKRLLSSDIGGKARVWDTATGKEVAGLAGATGLHLGPPAISADGKVACAVWKKDFVMVWKNLEDKNPARIKLPASDLFIEFTPDGKTLITGRWREGPVHVVDVAPGRVERSIGRDDVKAFAIAPDGRTLATFERTADYKKTTIRLWDLGTGKEKADIAADPDSGIVESSYASGQAHNGGLRFTPDGSGLLVQTRSGVGIWDVATRKKRTMLGGHGNTAISKN